VTSVLPIFNAQGPYCSGDSFTLPNTSINGILGTWSPAINNTVTTTYSFTPNSGQCANSTNLTITINPIVSPTFTQISPICSGGTISLPTNSLNGISGTWSPSLNNLATTTYTFTPTAGQCATTATMTVTVNSPTIPTFNQVAPICSGVTFSLPSTSSNGITGAWSPAINNSSTSNYTFTPSAGQCANNTTMTVEINPIYSVSATQTVCPSQIPYVWNGVTFNAPGTQTATLSSINNCDSVVAMTLNVSSTITSNTNLSVCQSDLPYSWNGLTFNTAGSQSINLIAVSGCDSVATLNLSVFTPQSSSVNQTVCQSQIPYLWNGLTFNGPETQTATLQDLNGCDSLASLTLQVSNTLSSSSSISVCPSELPYSWNGLTFNSLGSQTATLQSIGGCDSLATLTLSLNPTFNETETFSICSNETPYLWNGLSFSSSANQTISLNSINGCDSIVTLNLTVLPIFSTSLDSVVCQNELPLVWNGLIFNSEGTQTINLTSDNGCDSSIIMNLQVLTLPQASITGGGLFCEGDIIQPVEVDLIGSSPFNVSYTLDGVGFNISSNQSTVSLGNVVGTYVLTGISDLNCQVYSNLGSASIVINPIPNAPDVSDNSTYCLNYIPDTLFALGNSNALIFWYEEPSLQNVIQTGSFYYPENWLGETVYYVVQEENGCVSVPIEISITFENCDITIPTAFTPDNDLVNDVWVLDDIDAIYPKNRVSIYNRWGNLIYQSAQGSYESDPWNGKYKNEVMPVGSYYFIIEFNDESNDGVSGTVTIIK
jgi:gliding motility-associated-like protein